MSKRRMVQVFKKEAVKAAAQIKSEDWQRIKHYNKVEMAIYIQGVLSSGYHAGYDAAAKKAGPEWTPVTEELPKDDTMMLVATVTKKGVRSWNRAYYCGGAWHGSGSMSGVTHWMKGPALPGNSPVDNDGEKPKETQEGK